MSLTDFLNGPTHHDRGLPSYGTVAPEPGGPGPGAAAAHPVIPEGLLLVPPDVLSAIGDGVWQATEHLRNVSERTHAFPHASWHAVDRVILSSNPQIDGYQLKGNPVLVHGRLPTRRLTVYNPTQAPVYLGQTAGAALAAPITIVPAMSVMVLPWNADDLELAVDPIFVPPASGLELAPILVARSDRETDEIVVDPLPNVVSPQMIASSTLLAAAGVYTGAPLPANPGFVNARGYAFSDVAGTILMDAWIAGAWRQITTQAVAAGTSTTVNSLMPAPWCRARYVNGATPQGVFEIAIATVQP